MKARVLWIFVLFMLVEASNAITDTLDPEACTSFDDAVCGNVMVYSDNLSTQKEVLLAIMSQGDMLPKHDIVANWNSELVFTEPPENVSVDSDACTYRESDDCISDAWLRTFSAMPSYEEKDVLYIGSEGEFQAGFHYVLSTPSDVRYDNYCVCDRDDLPTNDEPYENDCITDYQEPEDLSTLTMWHNGVRKFDGEVASVGFNVLAPFTTTILSNDFSTRLDIINKIEIHHYGWRLTGSCPGCCSDECSDDPEEKDRYRCLDDRGIDWLYERLSLTHSLDAVSHQEPVVNHTLIFQGNDSITKGKIDTNARDFTLQLTKGSLTQDASKYALGYEYPPYNILKVKRRNRTDWFFDDMQVLETQMPITFQTYSHNIDSCYFSVNIPFEPFAVAEECNMTIKDMVSMKVSTDKATYLKNEPIIVNIEVDSALNATLHYGNNKTNVALSSGSNEIELEAKKGLYSIMVEFEGDETRGEMQSTPVRVFTQERSVVTTLIELAFILGIGYVLYRMYKHVMKKVIEV